MWFVLHIEWRIIIQNVKHKDKISRPLEGWWQLILNLINLKLIWFETDYVTIVGLKWACWWDQFLLMLRTNLNEFRRDGLHSTFCRRQVVWWICDNEIYEDMTLLVLHALLLLLVLWTSWATPTRSFTTIEFILKM